MCILFSYNAFNSCHFLEIDEQFFKYEFKNTYEKSSLPSINKSNLCRLNEKQT